MHFSFFAKACAASLSIFLLTGSINYSKVQLRGFAQSQHDPLLQSILFLRSAKLGDEMSAELLLASATGPNSAYWLNQLTLMGSSEAAYQLAMRASNPREQRRWFRVAANKGHAKSQFELSLLVQRGDEQFTLLEKSALQHYPPALITMAKYYHQNLRFSGDKQEQAQQAYDALHWLGLAAEFDEQSAFKLAKLYWQLQNNPQALSYFEQAMNMGNPKASDYIQVIKNNRIIEPEELFAPLPSQSYSHGTEDSEVALPRPISSSTSCAQTLQFIASSLDSVVQAAAFKARFDSDARFNDIPICIKPIAWVPSSVLKCGSSDEMRSNGRVNCDLSRLAMILDKPNFTHLVVFADSGRAFVQRGVMYLDRADEYSVFIHELAHFSGFVDEYALSAPLAQQHCSASYAPNIMIANSDESIDEEKLQQWKELDAQSRQNASLLTGANEQGFSISQSKTCKNVENISFKPSADITFLEHHDTNYIPQLYVALWQQQLQKHHGEKAVTQELLEIATRLQDEAAIDHWQSFQEPFLTKHPHAASPSTLQ
jgi:TPR repeat protein